MSQEKDVVILIGGGHSAGKRFVCEKIRTTLETSIKDVQIETINLDTFIKHGMIKTNDDVSPERFDFTKVYNQYQKLVSTKTKKRLVVLINGLYALYDTDLRSIASMKVFIDCDADTRLNRWIQQDVLEKGRKLEDILDEYLTVAKPEFNKYISATKDFADVILPGEDSTVGINLICDGIIPMLTNNDSSIDRHQSLHHSGYQYNETNLNIHSENFDGEKNRFYDLS